MKKYIILLLLSALQIALLIAIYQVMLTFYPQKRDLAFGIGLYYFQIYIFPLLVLAVNHIFFLIKNKIVNIVSLFCSIALVIYFWEGAFRNHPYKSLFMVSIAILILSIGAYFIKKKLSETGK